MEWSAYSDSAQPPFFGNETDDNGPASETPGEQMHRMFSFVCSIIMLILCCVGSVGNTLSMNIFTNRSMRSSINVLLSGLSAVDLSVLIASIFVYVLPGLNAYGHLGQLRELQIVIVCGLYQAGLIAQTCSVWLFVLITVERLIAVVFPLDAHRFLTVRRAKGAQVLVLAFAIGYNLVRFWEYELVYEQKDANASWWSWPLSYRRALRNDYGYFIGYYTASYILVHFVIPFPLITIFNIRILRAISAAGRQRFALMHKHRSKGDQKQQQQTTRMIVMGK